MQPPPTNRAAGLAYLFERFPSFTQTFCAREIQQWEKLGFHFPIFSIHSVEAEEVRHFPRELYERTITVPLLEKAARRWWTPFYFRSRAVRRRIYQRWGSQGGRQRAVEAAWLGPRLQAAGVKHVHVHFAGLAARTAFWLKQCHGISYSFTAHANDFFVRGEGQFLEDLFHEARFVVTVSDFSAQQLRERFPEAAGRIHRVYNGIDCASFMPPRGTVRASPAKILSVGRYIEKKGYPDLIKACALLPDLDFTCEIIGSGPLENALKQQVLELGVADKVSITGPKTEQEIRDLLGSARIFALACCRETDGGMDNLPTVIMEAMSAGLPVVSTRLAGVPEMIRPGSTGLLVEEHDVEGLAAALRQLLVNGDEAVKMGEAGLAMAREIFDSGVTSRALRDIFLRSGVIS
jgi:colanic acid/amylovoran biosynthesis glycosyltransferase